MNGQPSWPRPLGIAIGLGTHALFGVLVWRLFVFLAGGHLHSTPGSAWVNVLLAAQFAIPHSILLHPKCRNWLERWIPAPFYGCFFTVCTSASLFLMFWLWRSQPGFVWQLNGASRGVTWTLFGLSWAGLLYSISLTGLGYQTGWTPWWDWFRGHPPRRRAFQPRSLYRVLRHPVYLSFLGLVWFTPDMSFDRAVLTGVWTAYVFAGSYLKDERLAFFLGTRYREYQSRVAGYPFVLWGPLAKRPLIAAPQPSLLSTLQARVEAPTTAGRRAA